MQPVDELQRVREPRFGDASARRKMAGLNHSSHVRHLDLADMELSEDVTDLAVGDAKSERRALQELHELAKPRPVAAAEHRSIAGKYRRSWSRTSSPSHGGELRRGSPSA